MAQKNKSGVDRPRTFVVDDDPDMRDGIRVLLEDVGYEVSTYESGQALLDENLALSGVLLVDLRLKGLSGLALQQKLTAAPGLEIIFISGAAEVEDAVAAMKSGAHDFLVKPFREQVLIDAVNGAWQKVFSQQIQYSQRERVLADYRTLTETERAIAVLISQGLRNKEIARATEKSENTVKVHRSRIIHKMGISSPYELSLRLKAVADAI